VTAGAEADSRGSFIGDMSGETIFAPASGGGRAGIAVIRVSGPQAGFALSRLTGRGTPTARKATRVRLFARDGELIDESLVLWFPAPASFTGEDVAELHVHGGRAVVGGVLEALACCEGLRPAEPGEFTRRAFEHGKLDLTAAEALADLVNAETEGQRRQALRQFQGELGAVYDSWRERLIRAVAHLEATIDFSDEDLPGGIEKEIRAQIVTLSEEIESHLEDGHRGERLRDGIHLAIVGPPNAGKSSLFNVITGREAAIVSGRPGTTRDVVEVALDVGGYPVVIADTAGLRDATEEVEKEGVRRARMRARDADLTVAVFDGSVWPTVDGLTEALLDSKTIAVVNKSDLGRMQPPIAIGGFSALAVSALTGEGIDAMIAMVEQGVAARFHLQGTPALTRVRHRTALEECRRSLGRAAMANGAELVAEDLRLAARALGKITGRVDVEEILDVIFRDFCIGK
jgi:tRNA modification GTPase